jgi:hypothetical protein
MADRLKGKVANRFGTQWLPFVHMLSFVPLPRYDKR